MSGHILWQSDETYSNYRIPGLIVTARGTLLAYCEARRQSNDWAHMDILLFRSEDNGVTFSAPIILAEGTEQHPTVNNPVCIAEENGMLHFLYCRDYTIDGGDIFYRCSADDGRTWSVPRNIMQDTMPHLHNAFACGPGHGICTPDGLLLIPVWMVPKAAGAPMREHRPSIVSTLYSRDHGNTWQLGDLLTGDEACPDPNETQAAVTADGNIFLDIRLGGIGRRARAWSRTGISGWTAMQQEPAFPDPTCFGGVVRYHRDGKDALLAVSCHHAEERKNLICTASFDGGKTWPLFYPIETGDAGYADIAVCEDGTICVLYEQLYGIRDRLARFSFAAFTGNNI